MRQYIILLLLVGLAMAAAPSWVQAGTTVTYEQLKYNLDSLTSTGQLTLTVDSISGNDIQFEISIDGDVYRPKDNATSTFGENSNSWVDPSRLVGTLIVGQAISGRTIKELDDSFSVGGRTWNTVSFEQRFEGGSVVILRTYDRESGLMLEETTTIGFEETATRFVSIDPPLGGAAPPPATPTPQTPAPEPEEEEEELLVPEPPGAEEEEELLPSADLTLPVVEPPAEPERQNVPCVPFVFVLGIVGTGMLLLKR